jgi:16S rRNA (guanine966-N2)-methyltransferase
MSGSLRVIAGSLKGRRLKTPAWDGLRPTSDRLRETLFNVLAPQVAGARVLDGFAGTGALGIEALSRGASAVTFIDRDARAVALVGENLAHCGVAGGYVILRAPFERGVASLAPASSSATFDIVLLDPPYDGGKVGRSGAEGLGVLVEAASLVLAEGGVVVLEHARKCPVPESAGPLARVRQIVSGGSVLSFYAAADQGPRTRA